MEEERGKKKNNKQHLNKTGNVKTVTHYLPCVDQRPITTRSKDS